ncbi:dipeptidyl carboxypeptidase II [Novosphingobium sp. FSY-8]|uniref:Dipeptidyl carboxypeptidase II n=1 Tax=Novosphingobium ovatum TaxID=1908523 RepID=A0ABW9XEQ2_9SPHN|nr:M3 family metallopeptidase [Novosphingobium ovatum]NBC36994.1 dipeptidyl carboxypeptidase II [Novosphingobium ovatum]
MSKRPLLAVAVSALALMPAVSSVAQQAPAAPAAPVPAPGPFDAPSTLPFFAPDFARIKDADYKPAILRGIALKRAEIEAIAGNPDAPTFANTIEAMERSGQMLDRVMDVFSGVVSANTNDTLDAIDTEMSPKLAALNDSILLNARLFARVQSLYDRIDTLGLEPDQRQVLKVTYQAFAQNGARLSDADKAKLADINQQLASLSTSFGQKLTAATKDGALTVDDARQLSGLTQAEIAATAAAAKERGLQAGKHVIVLQNTTQQPLLGSLNDRATRQALYNASITRTQRGNANDTRELAVKIARLRADKARLLGFANYSAYALSDQMAQTPEKAMGFMQAMVPALAAQARREAADINALIARDGGKFKVQPWDWDRYAGRVRKAKLKFDEAQAKPYFEITRVLEDGVFYAANQLYGLTFEKRTDLPVYHPDVTVYTVRDKDGRELALFYFDPWKRDNKQGGAWMSNFVRQSTLLGQKPVIYNVENYTKPAAGQPALISFDDVITTFHEFGHALHGMLSNQRYPSIAGTNTARDFVEFPSQFNENWATHPQVIARYARHWQTGAPMPAAMVAKLKELRRVDQGYAMGEVVAAAMLDMSWHMQKPGATPTDVDAFEAQALKSTGLATDLVPPRYRTSYFRHIWANGYASAYYAYLWTEMLDHDAYAWFVQNGGMTRANGQRFRDMILSQGYARDYSVMYRNFAGRDPSVQPMLEARGLAAPKPAPAKKGAKK